MKSFHAALSSFAVFALAGGATLQGQTNYDSEVSVQLSTYDWVDQEAEARGHPAVDSPLLQRHLRDAVESELGKMGYRKATSGTPDFRIAYSVIAEEESRITDYGYGSYGYGGYGGFGRHGGFGRYGGFGGYGSYGSYGYPGAGYAGAGRVREYLRVTLVLDIIDVRTEEVVFREWERKSLRSDPSAKKVRKFVTKAVEEILEDFPRAGSASGQLVAAR